MQRRLTPCILVLALWGCGPAPDNTTISGNTPGLPSTPIFQDPIAIYDIKSIPIVRDQLAVLISDRSLIESPCNSLHNDPGQDRPFVVDANDNHMPSLWMRMTDHNPVFPNMRGIGDDLEANWDPGAPASDSQCNLNGCPANWIAATKGSADMDSSDDPSDSNAVARGDYYLTFADGSQLSGNFDATACTGMSVKGCSVAGGALMPSLALLALVLLRRRRR